MFTRRYAPMRLAIYFIFLLGLFGCGTDRSESNNNSQIGQGESAQMDSDVQESGEFIAVTLEKSYPRGTSQNRTITDPTTIKEITALLPALSNSAPGIEGEAWRPIGKVVLNRRNGPAVVVEVGFSSYSIDGSKRGSFDLSGHFVPYMDRLLKNSDKPK
jgi:hypothetical protein